MARLTWHGDQIVEQIVKDAETAVDRTMDDCVAEAKARHDWQSDTGELEGSIYVMQGATSTGGMIRGRWGSDLPHALYMEIGTSRIGQRVTPREQEGGGNMWQIPGPTPAEGVTVTQDFTILPPGTMRDSAGEPVNHWVTLKGRPSRGTGPLISPRPFLRPAADTYYRLLKPRLAAIRRGERP